MTVQRGRDFVLQIEDNGTFHTVAGLRANRLALASETVDATDMQSAGQWRELIEGAGARQVSVAGEGIFRDEQSDELIRSRFFEDKMLDCRLLLPDFGTLAGLFQITRLEYAGRFRAELTFSIQMESAGLISFSAL